MSATMQLHYKIKTIKPTRGGFKRDPRGVAPLDSYII